MMANDEIALTTGKSICLSPTDTGNALFLVAFPVLEKTNPLSPKVFWVTFGLQNPHDHRSVIHGDLKFLPCMTIMFIELDDGNILTGKPNQFDGKNPWVSG